jgi:hypothetical protein
MGKKGNIALVMPKNSGTLSEFDKAIEIVNSSDGLIPMSDWQKKMGNHLSNENLGTDTTSAIHKTVMPRYFGLLEMTKVDKISMLQITDFGHRYVNCISDNMRIDLMFDVLQNISFGRNNNGVQSDSNVEAPVTFLKMMKDLRTISGSHFGCLLYYLEVQGISYEESLKKIKNISDIRSEVRQIKGSVGTKLFDIKFTKILKELNITQDAGDNEYKISSYVLDEFGELIDDFIIFNSTDIIPEDTEKYKHVTKNINDKVRSLIKIFDHSDNHTEPIIIPKKSKKNKTGSSRKLQIIGRNKKKDIFEDELKFQMGWRGEQYINDLLNKHNLLILENLKFTANEKIDNIEWFNFGFQSDAGWIDMSRGKGCDIEIKTNKRDLKVEVKTSIDSINFYTATGNELKLMKKYADDYFLIKINKFSNINSDDNAPQLTVIQNPIISLENLENIKAITLYQ